MVWGAYAASLGGTSLWTETRIALLTSAVTGEEEEDTAMKALSEKLSAGA